MPRNWLSDLAGKRAYIATAQALDAEMAARIAKHRKDRGQAWDTYEEPLAVAELLRKLSGRYQVVLLDCLTLWLCNVMAHTNGDGEVISRSEELVDAVAGVQRRLHRGVERGGARDRSRQPAREKIPGFRRPAEPENGPGGG